MAEPTGGHINLHRGLRDHPYWEDPERLKAWIDILFMAAWKAHRRLIGTNQVDLDRGQFVASERFLADRWRWSRGKVRRFLQAATEAKEIRPCGDTSDGTVYLVVKYDDYQTGRPTDDTANRTTNGPPTVPAPDQIEEGKKKEKKGAGAKKVKLPEDWKPNDLHRQLAKREGVDVDREAANFRDHAEANGRRMIDWNAAFRTWLRKANDYGSGRPGGSGAVRKVTGERFIPGLHD